jgi:hypothetical protein
VKNAFNTQIYDFTTTSFVHSFFPHFEDESDKIISNILRGKRWREDKSYLYYQKSAEAIKDMWDVNRKEASELGTLMHARIELFYNHPTLWMIKDLNKLKQAMLKIFAPDELQTKELNQFLHFHLQGPVQWKWEPFRTELRVFDRDIQIAGSVDMLYKSPDYTDTNKWLIMLDWKRSKEIEKSSKYKKRAKHPISEFEDANYWKYSLQLNTYKTIIEKNTTYKIQYMALGVFHPNFESYQVFEVAPLPDAIRKMWLHRLQQLNKK